MLDMTIRDRGTNGAKPASVIITMSGSPVASEPMNRR
jgi:hypothetical protein